MKNYIQTGELTEKFNIARSSIYYWVKHDKLSKPIKDSTNHFLWEQKHIEQIRDILKNKYKEVEKNQASSYFELNNRRYLGNKYKLIPFIKTVINENCEGISSFFDVFSGTGVVAEAFRSYELITNDILYSNYISHYAFFSSDSYDSNKLHKLIKKWNKLNSIKEDNYMSLNFGNKYFSMKTAAKIGYIREEISKMKSNKKISKREEAILITSLIYAMDKIANTCGHYDAYRKDAEFCDNLEMKFPNIKSDSSPNNTMYNQDSNELAKTVYADVAYIDPPYNSRQYSDAYHLLENVAKWEKPEVFGIAGKMDRNNLKSDYCTKKAPEVFNDLINSLNAKYILVSYNNMGIKGNDRSNAKISDDEILDILEKTGTVEIFDQDYKPFSSGKSDIENHKERLFLCKTFKYNKQKEKPSIDVASPLNYTGGKYKLLNQIKPKFPKEITNMIDLFSGGCNVGINTNCKNIKFIDKQQNLIRLFNTFSKYDISDILNKTDSIIAEFGLSDSAQNGYDYYNCSSSDGLASYNKIKYLHLREIYNSRKENSFYYDIMFYVLIVFGFNNQIRFNNKGEYNLPVGKRDFNIKMRQKLTNFINRIKENNYEFIACDFVDLNADEIEESTFVYADPPYLITTAAYNEQGGWNSDYETNLLLFLDKLHNRNIKFALSNVIESKGKRNEILINWTIKNKDKYNVHYLDYDYSNSNYHTKNRDKTSTLEVLITNY